MKRINWNEVKVGETEIVNPKTGTRRLIKGREGGYVWAVDLCGDACGQYLSWKEYAYDNWTIYDPWEEITDLVQLVPYCESDYLFCMEFEWRTIYHHDPNFKRDGRRVWKRKEN